MSYFTVNEQYAFGIDISRYNSSKDGSQTPDFDIIAAHQPRVSFIIMRSGVSWAYQDPLFAHYLAQARRIGAACLAYHVFYPGQPVDAQVFNLLHILKAAGADPDQLRLVLDVEKEFDCQKERITQELAQMLDMLQQKTGQLAMLYSRANWVDRFLRVEALPKVDWWLAQYCWDRPHQEYTPEYPCPPKLPHGVSRWTIHQTAEKAPAIGGGPNRTMDYNRWNGGEQAVRRYCRQPLPRIRKPGRQGLEMTV